MLMRGLYTALITPFDTAGQLDEEGLRHNIRFQIKHGVDGILLLGSTGESSTLSTHEKERVIRIGVEEAKHKVPIWIGTGSFSTDQTIENTRRAKELGADGALVVTPYYNKPTPEGLYRHFKALTESVQFPICLYNTQGRTCLNIQPETLKRIATLPGIIGVKEASGHLAQIDEVIQSFAHKPSFAVLSGDDFLAFPVMVLGGHGVISVVSNLVIKPMKELVHACLEGDFMRARALHQQLSFLFKDAFIETNPIPIKAAMKISHMPSGSCRLPLCDLSSANKEHIQAMVNKIPKEWL